MTGEVFVDVPVGRLKYPPTQRVGVVLSRSFPHYKTRMGGACLCSCQVTLDFKLSPLPQGTGTLGKLRWEGTAMNGLSGIFYPTNTVSRGCNLLLLKSLSSIDSISQQVGGLPNFSNSLLPDAGLIHTFGKWGNGKGATYGWENRFESTMCNKALSVRDEIGE